MVDIETTVEVNGVSTDIEVDIDIQEFVQQAELDDLLEEINDYHGADTVLDSVSASDLKEKLENEGYYVFDSRTEAIEQADESDLEEELRSRNSDVWIGDKSDLISELDQEDLKENLHDRGSYCIIDLDDTDKESMTAAIDDFLDTGDLLPADIIELLAKRDPNSLHTVISTVNENKGLGLIEEVSELQKKLDSKETIEETKHREENEREIL